MRYHHSVFTGNVRGALVSVLAIATASCLVACGDSDADGASGSGLEADAANVVCGRLRTYTNDLVRVANETVTGINSLTPEERTAAILAGFDGGLEVARGHAALVDELQLGESLPEAEGLHDELTEGAAAAIDELIDERAHFERDVPEVGDTEVAGRTSQFFNAFEKAMSVTEPAIAAYDRRELSEAFLAEPTCRHVIQQFRLED